MNKLLSLLTAVMLVNVPSVAAQPVSNTPSDIRMVIYDNGSAFVSEKRKVSLDGSGVLTLSRIPATVNEQTLQAGGGFRILAVESGVPEAFWLKELVGQEVTLVSGTNSVTGELKRIMGSSLFLTTGTGQVFIPDYMQYRVQFNGATPEAVSGNRMQIRYAEGVKGAQDLLLSYQVPGVTWTVSYEMQLSEKGDSATLSAWADVMNHSGHDFGTASIRLVAGQLNRVQSGHPNAPVFAMSARGGRAKGAMMEEAMVPDIADENAVSEYYSFDLNGKTALTAQRLRKWSLFSAPKVSIQKAYIFDGYPEEKTLKPVAYEIRLKNDKNNGLGRVLPAGTMRVYEEDAAFTTLIGEAPWKNLPAGDEGVLPLGRAMDIQAAHWLVESKQQSPKVLDETLEYRLVNRKQEAVRITLRKETGTKTSVLKSDISWQTPRAGLLESVVDLKPGEDRTIKLSLRYTYE